MNAFPNHRRALLLMAVLCLVPFAAFGASRAATITYLEGSVTVDGSPASVGDAVPLGATVGTDRQSLCEITFRDHNVLRLGEATSLVFDPANLQVGSRLQQGSVALVLRNLIKGAGEEHSFFLRTPTTAAGVRGTVFFVKVEDLRTTYVCLCNGEIDLDDGRQVGGMRVKSSHHTAYRLSAVGGTVSVSPAPLLYHTDGDMEMLASHIGAAIDWSVVEP